MKNLLKKIALYGICLLLMVTFSSMNPHVCSYYSVKFKNLTNKEVHLAVNYIPQEMDPKSGDWKKSAWYIFEPGETKLIFHTRCYSFYYYADTPHDNNGNWDEWSGDTKIRIDDKVFKFRKEDTRNFNVSVEGDACVITVSLY